MSQPIIKILKSGAIFVLLLLAFAFIGACGDAGENNGNADAGNGDADQQTEAPVVTSVKPADGATDVHLNAEIKASFSQVMDGESLSISSFTLTTGDTSEAVDGQVRYFTGSGVVFFPDNALQSETEYTATISTEAKSADGISLEEDYVWTFTTGDTLLTGHAVNLGTADDYVILAKSGISTVPESDITGDIAISPAAASSITGFSLTADASNEFATATQVSGKVYASNYSPPTPSLLTTAVGDMELGFTAASGRAADVTELGAGDVSGMTLEAGVYKWSSGLMITSDVTLEGSSDDVWIFQIAQDLTVTSGANILLEGGAVPQNVFWQVSGRVDIGTTAHLEGVIMSQTAITMATGATINGRLLAQTAVELDSNTVTQPTE